MESMTERLRAVLARDYGIKTDEELMEALDKEKGLEIGIFVSRCGRKELHDVKATA